MKLRSRIRLVCAGLLPIFVLSKAGNLLVVEEQAEKADAIFMLMGVAGERALLCADLYKQGLAPKIIVTNTASDQDQKLLLSKGIEPVFDTQYVRHILVKAGVPSSNIVVLPGPANITIDEGRSLASFCSDQPGIKKVLVATSNYHTRRSRWILSREIGSHKENVQLVFPANPYSAYNPAQWWRSRKGIATTALEYSKIVYYWLWNRWFYSGNNQSIS